MIGHQSKVAVALALVLCAVAHASEDPTGKLPGVHDLTPATFDKVIDGSKAALIEFFAPWCGHCKALTPAYKELGSKIAADPKLNSQVVIAKVDADEHRELGERFGVQGFPTLKWFPIGRPKDPVDYNGARSADAMLEWIQEQMKNDAAFARVPELSEIAIKLTERELTADEALAKAKEVAATLSEDLKDNAALYIKYIEKAKANGNEWLGTEGSRLLKLSESGKMSPAKLLEIRRKISVLESFAKPIEIDFGGEEDEDPYADVGDVAGDDGDEYLDVE